MADHPLPKSDVERRTERVIALIREELNKARTKFPSTRHLMVAKTEEDGELANALIEHHRQNPEVSAFDVVMEAVQSAAMAIRVATEGDSDFDFDPSFLTGMEKIDNLIEEIEAKVKGGADAR